MARVVGNPCRPTCVGITMRRTLVAAFILSAAFIGPAWASAEEQAVPSTREGPPGTVVTISPVPDECPGEATVFLAPLDERESNPPGEPFTPPTDTFTVPEVPPDVYQILVVCPNGNAVAGFRFTVTPGAITADPNFAG
jgi:hypothetical protein